jgi:hypothetical protein
MKRAVWMVMGAFGAALAAVPAEAGMPSKDMPACEEFFDKWDAPGVPPTMMAMMGFSRETFAAKDCLDKNDVATACAHWQNLLAVIDKLKPALDDSRDGVVDLMKEHDCQASEAAPGEEPPANSDAGPEQLE